MATIRKAIESITGDEDEKKKAREMLTLLAEACDARAKVMEQDLKTYIRTAGTDENKTIPISDILTEYFETRVTTKESINDIPTEVGEAIKKIMSNNIVDGVVDIVSTTLTALLGSSSGGEVTRRQYFVCIEGLSMVRYDISYWARDITVETLKKYQEKSCVCILVKSSIDPENLKFNTFLNIYQTLLEKKTGLTNDELIEYIEAAKKVYKALLDENNIRYIEEDLLALEASPIQNLAEYLTTESSSFEPTGEWPCRIA